MRRDDPVTAGGIARRLFLVGCPRSGTTLLQAMLASHPAVFSLPETDFVWRVVGQREALIVGGRVRSVRALLGRARIRLGLCVRDTDRAWAELAEVAGAEVSAFRPRGSLSIRRQLQAFARALDCLALERGKAAWLEKTPDHVFYLDAIQRCIPGVAAIHVIRRGEDVVASLRDAALRYPGGEGGWARYRDWRLGVARWNASVSRSLAYRGAPGHLLVRHEDVAAKPEDTLQRICRFAGLDFEPSMLRDYQEASARVSRREESWKAGVRGSIEASTSDKFDQLFTADERAQISTMLIRPDW